MWSRSNNSGLFEACLSKNFSATCSVFTGCLIHGFLPESMLSVLLVPVIKDKTGRISSIENYRPIALASVISKVFEWVLMDRLK